MNEINELTRFEAITDYDIQDLAYWELIVESSEGGDVRFDEVKQLIENLKKDNWNACV